MGILCTSSCALVFDKLRWRRHGLIFRACFTLLELLVVIAIIAILASLLLPALQNARTSAQGIKCLNNVKALSLARSMYVDDNGGYFDIYRYYNGGDPSKPVTSYPAWMLLLATYFGREVDVAACCVAGFSVNSQGAMDRVGVIPSYRCPNTAFSYSGSNQQQRVKYQLYSYGSAPYIGNTGSKPQTLTKIDRPSLRASFFDWGYFTYGVAHSNNPARYCPGVGRASGLGVTIDPVSDEARNQEMLVGRHGATINVSFFDGSAQKLPVLTVAADAYRTKNSTPPVRSFAEGNMFHLYKM